MDVKLSKSGTVLKGWGSEEIWASNELYCAKYLHFNKGGRMSMHFHINKTESWLVIDGVFDVEYIRTADATKMHAELFPDDSLCILPGTPHRITCREAGKILEVSTPDDVNDNYRVEPGDSQRETK